MLGRARHQHAAAMPTRARRPLTSADRRGWGASRRHKTIERQSRPWSRSMPHRGLYEIDRSISILIAVAALGVPALILVLLFM